MAIIVQAEGQASLLIRPSLLMRLLDTPACVCLLASAGAITLSALEGRSGRDSPQTLVTCIVRADWGGWLSSKSAFYSLSQVR